MELDTGAAVSIISRDMKEKYFPSTPLQMSRVVLCTYTNERMGVVGELNVEVGDKGQEKKLKLYVVEQEGPTLFGRNWLEQIQLDWKAIQWASAESHEDMKPLIDKYNNVFSDELGAITGFEAHLEVKPQATPVFCKARPILFSLKPQVDQELDRLVDVGILKRYLTVSGHLLLCLFPKRTEYVGITKCPLILAWLWISIHFLLQKICFLP